MATDRTHIGIVMDMDVTDLKAGLVEANKRIQLANSEFKNASSGMDDWTKSTEGLNVKIKQLDTVLELQRKKMSGLEYEYQKLVDSGQENSEQARRLKVQMNNLNSVINSTERECKNYKETLEQVENGTIDLENVSLKGGKSVNKLGKEAEKSEGGFTVLKGAIATFVGNALTSLVNGCKNAITSVLGLSEATREYRQTLATLEAGAGDVGVSTDYIKDKFTDLMGVFNDQDSVTEGLNNLLTAGFDEKSLDSITTALEGASLKWKDTLKFEGLSDSLQEWIGSGGANLTGNFAELLERMGYNLDDVKAKTKGMTDEQRRNYAVNLLNKEGLDEVSKSYREQNKDMVEAQKANINYQNAMADLGAKMEPITTKIREGFTRILEKVMELVEGVDLQAFGEKITVAFDYFINTIIPAIVNGIQWILDNKDILLASIVAIGSAFLAWKVVSIIQGIITAFKTWKTATEGLTLAQRLLNLVMKANPIGLIISLIVGLVTAFITLWNTSDKFRQFWIDLWEKIKKVCSIAWKAITGFFTDGWKSITGIWKGAKEFFSKKVDDIVGAFKNIKDKFLETGENIVKGIWDGITGGATWLKNKITGFAGDVAGWFKKTFKIKSPSQLMADEVGIYIGEGIGEGVLKSLPTVKKDLSKFSNFVSGNLGNIKGGLSINSSSGSSLQGGRTTTISAPLTVNYNGKLSRKEIKKAERTHYTQIKTKLQMEGAI